MQKITDLLEGYLTPGDAAKVIGLSRSGMNYAMRHGLLDTETIGGYRLIRREVAEAYRDMPFPPGRGRPRGALGQAKLSGN